VSLDIIEMYASVMTVTFNLWPWNLV